MCSDRGYLPLIVFSFSRKDCEASAAHTPGQARDRNAWCGSRMFLCIFPESECAVLSYEKKRQHLGQTLRQSPLGTRRRNWSKSWSEPWSVERPGPKIAQLLGKHLDLSQSLLFEHSRPRLERSAAATRHNDQNMSQNVPKSSLE